MSEDRIVGGFAGYAIVELMGHRQRAGYAQEVELAGGKMLRVDMHVGEQVVTEFYGSAAIYSIRPCTEEVARAFHGKHDDPRPIRPVAFRDAERPALAASRDDDDDGLPL